MNSLETAIATAPAIGAVGSHFMLDGNTYKKGAELGFQGLDFYACGRGGVLGDVDADVVSAALTFFEPDNVRTLWTQGRAVMAPAEATAAFAACCADWAEDHVPDGFDATRLADLASAVIAGARTACAPAFGGWRALPVPSAPKAAAVHQMNVLRELRNGLHGAAVIAAGLTPLQAVSIRSPQMVALFGWPEAADTEGLQA
ncbi:MAG: hypothetical protein Q8K72_09225, partial [Acidimicrobiales bacterium]|nr:hypothetical protein [Acidimicrobiales bacterium]